MKINHQVVNKRRKHKACLEEKAMLVKLPLIMLHSKMLFNRKSPVFEAVDVNFASTTNYPDSPRLLLDVTNEKYVNESEFINGQCASDLI